jgi:hypothetical protein
VSYALGDLLSLVDLGNLLLKQLVTALTELDDASILLDPSCLSLVQGPIDVAEMPGHGISTGDLLQDLLGDFGGDLVLGKSIRVRESVVCSFQLASMTG